MSLPDPPTSAGISAYSGWFYIPSLLLWMMNNTEPPDHCTTTEILSQVARNSFSRQHMDYNRICMCMRCLDVIGCKFMDPIPMAKGIRLDIPANVIHIAFWLFRASGSSCNLIPSHKWCYSVTEISWFDHLTLSNKTFFCHQVTACLQTDSFSWVQQGHEWIPQTLKYRSKQEEVNSKHQYLPFDWLLLHWLVYLIVLIFSLHNSIYIGVIPCHSS